MRVIFICLVFYINGFKTYSQSITLSGFIKDFTNNEAIIGATIYEANQKIGTTSNEYGYYSLTLKSEDTVSLLVAYLGYQPEARKVYSHINMRMDILLAPTASTLEEVVINAYRNNDNVQRAQMGVINVPMKAIMGMPAVAGERDILKAIQLLPGVQAGQEGTTGYFVRGGNLDQNLVQLDEAVVYNPNHLFGLFSTFNVNSINNVKLIKGGFPAEFGGRLSSILDIQLKEGDNQHHHIEGGVGLLSNNLKIEGPLQKNKSSFMMSGRQTHINLLLKPLSSNTSGYRFYDINAKINYALGTKDRLFLSFFKGNDNAVYSLVNSLKYTTDFGNTTGTMRWNHLLGDKIFANTSFIYNDYHLGLNTEQNSYYSSLFTGIRDVSAKADITFIPNAKHKIKTGVHYTYHTLYPAAFSVNVPRRGNRISIKQDRIEQFFSHELAFYAGDEFNVSNSFGLQYGLRLPVYSVSGKTYMYLEPRLTSKISISPYTSLKASFTMMNQFLHLIPNATAGLPTDIWIPSSAKTKPQQSSQVALGIFKNFKDDAIEASIEVYHKKMNNQALFEEGNQLNLKANLDSSLVYGKGKSYGAEVFVKKNDGKFTGWMSYTLSWSEQHFKDLNFGNPFPFKYDRRHVLSFAGNYDWKKKWKLSSIFTYSSGAPYTLPTGRVASLNSGSIFEGNYFVYEGRNNYRMNGYHRLDLGATYHARKRMFKRPVEIEWIFGVYNTYSRQNPYFVYLTLDPLNNRPIAKQVSLLPIIPSVSFNFKF